MSEKSKGIAKSLSALTLIVATSAGAAMANDTAALVSPSEEAVAQATAIQLEDFALNDGVLALAATGDHDHDHSVDIASGSVVGSEFNV